MDTATRAMIAMAKGRTRGMTLADQIREPLKKLALTCMASGYFDDDDMNEAVQAIVTSIKESLPEPINEFQKSYSSKVIALLDGNGPPKEWR